MKQMLWATGAQLHCTPMGLIQKAYCSFPPEGQEAGPFIPIGCKLPGGGGTTPFHLRPRSLSIGKVSGLELRLSAQSKSEFS